MSSGSGKNESETSAGGSLYGGYDITARFNPSMAVIIVVLLSAFFFMGFLSIYVRRCAGDNEEEEPSNTNSRRSRRPRATSTTTQGLDKSVINRFPVVTFSVKQAMKRGEKSTDCAVCLCEFEEDEVLRMLPRCSHWFHRECIDMWLFSHSTCPLCRRTVLTPENSSSPCMLHSSQAQPDNQSSLVIIVGNEHTAPPPPQQQEVHVTASSSLSPPNSPILGGETVSFRRSHSTGHSLMRFAGDPLHPSYLYGSTVGRSNHGDVGFFPMTLVHSNKAGLHRCNSSGIGIPGFDSKPERDDESEQRQSLWMYPSSTADYLCQDLPPHSQGRLNVHRGRQNTLLSPQSPYLVRALAGRRDGVNLNLNGSTSSCDTSSPGSYLQNLRRNGLSWFKS